MTIIIGIIMIAILSVSCSPKKRINNKQVIISTEMEMSNNPMHDDMREAILEFANEYTPADSLYMPDFLK